jgi:hypothetical protein
MHNDTTPTAHLPLPHLGNLQEEDVPRLREAITQIDTALAARELLANKGAANGYAPLGADSKLAAIYLPSYVDDVLEFAALAALPASGEGGKIYVALDTNRIYRWSGSTYIEVDPSPGSTDAVPEGSSNMYFTGARVLSTVLAGFSAATNAVVNAGDSVLSACGKLQAQISALLATVTAHINNTANPHNTVNISGTAGNITGVAAVANGGTGQQTVLGIASVLNRGLYARETSGGTLVANTAYAIYSPAAASMSLPTAANTQAGDVIVLQNLGLQWATSNFTVNQNTNTRINMTTEALVCNVNVGAITLRCVNHDGTAYWHIC